MSWNGIPGLSLFLRDDKKERKGFLSFFSKRDIICEPLICTLIYICVILIYNDYFFIFFAFLLFQ